LRNTGFIIALKIGDDACIYSAALGLQKTL